MLSGSIAVKLNPWHGLVVTSKKSNKEWKHSEEYCNWRSSIKIKPPWKEAGKSRVEECALTVKVLAHYLKIRRVIQCNSLRLVDTLLPHKFTMNAGSDVILGQVIWKLCLGPQKVCFGAIKWGFYSKEQDMILQQQKVCLGVANWASAQENNTKEHQPNHVSGSIEKCVHKIAFSMLM